MKVSVLGSGAVGSMLGGLIQYHCPEVEVCLLVRGQHGEVLERRGRVRLLGPWGQRDVPICASTQIEDLAGSDFVLLTVKSHATAEAIEAAAGQLGDAIVVSIQNGINDALLLEHVHPERLVMGMTATNMAILEPGTVSLQLDGTTVLGPFSDGRNAPAADAAARLLSSSGLQVDHHVNVLGVRYNKLAINAVGYASCLSQSNFITDAICHRAWRTHVGLPIIDECLVTFREAQIELARIPGRPDVEGMRRQLKLLNVPVVGSVISLGARQFYNKKPIVFSLYQDLLRGKATEVDHINGAIARLAAEQGRSAPYNSLVAEMVHELERRGAGRFFAREEVISRFRQLSSKPALAA